MKLGYIVALLVIVLMIGCATTEPEAPAAPAAPAEPEPPAEEAAPAAPVAPPEEALPEEPEEELSDADEARIETLKASCEKGVVKICLVLKNQYGIEWPPEEEPEVAGETAE